jgi:iron uptake system component EfeO
VGNVGKLNGIVATLAYKPEDLANGASDLIEEIQNTKITGEEEAYSKIDLLDFEANVEGSLQSFATLKPALDQIDPTLVPQIAAAFDALTAVLDKYRDPASASGWVSYDQLTAADKKVLTDALLVVQEPLSAISAKITN